MQYNFGATRTKNSPPRSGGNRGRMNRLSKKGKIFFFGAVCAALLFLASVAMFVTSVVKASEKADAGYDLNSANVVKMAIGEGGERIAGTQSGDLFAFGEDGTLFWEVGKLRESAVYDIAVKDGRIYAVFADGFILSFREEDARKYSAAEDEEQEKAPFGEYETYRLDYSISGNVSNTQLLVGEGEAYLRAKCNDGANRNYIFRLADGRVEQVRRSAGSALLGGMTYCGGVFYYSYRGQLLANEETVLELDEDILALSSSEGEVDMITASGNFVVFDVAAGQATESKPLSVSLDTAYVFSTGENFLAKIKNGGVVYISSAERAVVLSMNAGNNANFILWTDDCFTLRDMSDVNEPFVLFYSLSLARSVAVFSALRWAFLALALFFFAAAAVLSLCMFDGKRKKLAGAAKDTAKAVWRDRAIYLALLLPFVLLIVFYYVPIVLGFSISFLDYVPGERAVFEGFKYFGMVLRSSAFWQSTGTMALFLIADILKALIPPFIIAELLFTVRFKRFSLWVRILLFLPGILPGVAATLVWQQGIFDASTNSLVNAFIKLFAPSFTGLNWIYNPSYGVRILSIVCFGFPWVGSYLIFFGALGGINSSIFEAAKLDGCPWWKRVLTMDIPLILSQFKYVLITTFIASVQNYGTLYILYGTGAGDTLRTPALMMYSEIMAGNYNLASVMGVFLFLFLAVVTVLNFRSQREQIE